VFADLGLPRAYDLYAEALAEILEARCTPESDAPMADPLRADVEALAVGLEAEESRRVRWSETRRNAARGHVSSSASQLQGRT
jgi:hypothetical protein